MTVQSDYVPSGIEMSDMPGSTNNEAALRALYASLLASWERGDGYAYANHFTEDADYVAFDGSHTKGRGTIGESHHKLFQTWLKGTRLTGKVTQVRLLSPTVALVHATGGTIMPGRSEDQVQRLSIQTLVATQSDGRWLFTAFHNTRIQHWNLFKYLLFGIGTKLFRR